MRTYGGTTRKAVGASLRGLSWCVVLVAAFIPAVMCGPAGAQKSSWQPVKGHEWRAGRGWGYSGTGGDSDLTDAYLQRIRVLPPIVKTVLATSQVAPRTWSYTTEKPGEDWYKGGFDDSAWKTGPAGFGDFNPTHPTLIVSPRTRWTGSDIWIRLSFDLDDTDFASPYFLIHHDEIAKVYINGRQVLDLPWTSNFYTWVPLDKDMSKALKAGKNIIAVHCHNEHHPQYIDAGIIDVLPLTQR